MTLMTSVPKILEFIESNEKRVVEAKKKLNIYEGELLPYVESALKAELNPAAFERARKRIAPVNFLPKVVNKLSTLYNNTVIRELKGDESEKNQEIFDLYLDMFNMDESGRTSNQQLNLNKYTAWEIYINNKNEPKLRTLPANQFLVYSDDREDPTNPTTFIKFLGGMLKEEDSITEGEPNSVKQVAIYKLYTDNEIIVVDSDGEKRNEFMEQNPTGVNPYGTIPFIYVRKARHSLLPYEDTSDIPMITLIPLLLTDLNYATQFMSHSIIYAIDAEIGNADGNPDSIWMIKSDESPNGESLSKASIGTIKPEVDIDKVITLIQTQLALWLDSKDLKAQGIGKLEASNLASGISKMIDDADTTQAIRNQIDIYTQAENELFLKLTNIHNVWFDQGLLKGTKLDSRIINELDVTIIFEEKATFVDEKERLETIKLKEDSGYTTRRRAVTEANPSLDEKEITQLLVELDEQKEEESIITIVTEDDKNGTNENVEPENEDQEVKEE